MKNNQNNKPVFEKKLGQVQVTVWENYSDNGSRWFNVNITRRYKDGDEWKDSSSFSGLFELALVAEGCRLARDFITARDINEAGENA